MRQVTFKFASKPSKRLSFVSRLLDGHNEKVMFDKITSRVSKLCYSLNQEHVDPVSEHVLGHWASKRAPAAVGRRYTNSGVLFNCLG